MEVGEGAAPRRKMSKRRKRGNMEEREKEREKKRKGRKREEEEKEGDLTDHKEHILGTALSMSHHWLNDPPDNGMRCTLLSRL